MKFVLGFVCAVLAAAIVCVIVFYSGWYNVAASETHGPFAQWALGTTMQNSVRARAARLVPPSDLASRARRGSTDFDEMCVQCHGAPGKDRSEVGKGLSPQPPALTDAARRWSSSEIFWIVKNGVRMTGMPAFGPTHDDDRLWAIVAFVEELPKLSPEQYKSMQPSGAAPPHSHDDSHEHVHTDHHH